MLFNPNGRRPHSVCAWSCLHFFSSFYLQGLENNTRQGKLKVSLLFRTSLTLSCDKACMSNEGNTRFTFPGRTKESWYYWNEEIKTTIVNSNYIRADKPDGIIGVIYEWTKGEIYESTSGMAIPICISIRYIYI